MKDQTHKYVGNARGVGGGKVATSRTLCEHWTLLMVTIDWKEKGEENSPVTKTAAL